ncbi:MAG TPA: diguanylate cyclase, partial [Coleofasciculaceae cyanobacterium]
MVHEPWYIWTPKLLWLHVWSHSFIALFYYSIAILLVYWVYQHKALPYQEILLLFGIFTLASGTAYVTQVGALWYPNSAWFGRIEMIAITIAVLAALLAGVFLLKVLAGWMGNRELAKEDNSAEVLLESIAKNFPQSSVANPQDIQRRVRWLEELGLLESLCSLISEAPDFHSALHVALRLVCEVTHWDYGEAWLPRSDDSVLECSPAWYSKTPSLEAFRLSRETLTFLPNTGLPGRVWSSRRPEWVETIGTQTDGSCDRTLIASTQLKAGFAVPILLGDRVLAVLSFFINQSRTQDKQLVELVSAVATQLGLVMQRKQLEEELRHERDFNKTLIETSSAFFVAVDGKGKTIMLNQAFLDAVGYTQDEVLGTDYLAMFARKCDRKAISKTFKRQIKSRQPILKENYVLTKDGRELLVEWRGRPIFRHSQAESGNEGELDFFFGVGIDITERKQLEQELRKSEERYRAVVEDQTELICRFVADGTLTFVNDAYCRYFNKTRSELLGSNLFQLIPDEYREKTQTHIAKLSRKNPVATREHQILMPDGETHWILWTDRLLVHRIETLDSVAESVSNSPVEFQSVGRDITQRRKAQQESAWLASLALLSPNPIVETDLVGEVRYLNPEAMRLLPDLQDLGSKHPFLERVPSMASVLQSQGSLRREVKVGEVYYEQVLHYLEEIEGFRIYAFDITDRKLAEQQIIHNAFYDQLTGLPNRALFMDRLRQAVQRTKQYRSTNVPEQSSLFAVVFLNLNRFKLVNDTLGNRFGDQLLQGVAERLQACLHPTDTLARLGGDEFAILLEGIQGVGDAIQVAESIHETIASPFYLNESEVFITLSIGIALNTGSSQPETLLRNADLAMYRARSKGTSCYEVFDAAMHQRAVNQLQMETDLRRAIERHEFQVHYQPIVSLLTAKIIGFEALLRWQHPKRGLVSPGEFIPTAEETGLITPIGWWTLREACRQLSIWQERFPRAQPLTMNVNLSCKQFTQPDLLDRIDAILQET